MSKQLPFYCRQAPSPNNDPAEWLPGFETEREAADRYVTRGKLMFNKKSPPHFFWCTQTDPCDSAACPLCMREFRRWWVDAGSILLQQQPGPLSAASLIHYSLARCPGKLHDFDLGKAKRQLARHLDRAELSDLVAIGGFDFCYVQPVGGGVAHWQPHAYVVFQSGERTTIKKNISRFYPKRPNIPRPVWTRDVRHPIEALSYALKAVFWRRSSYIDATGRANTRPLPLSREAECELLSYLDQLRPVDRVFLKNVRRRGATFYAAPPDGEAPN